MASQPEPKDRDDLEALLLPKDEKDEEAKDRDTAIYSYSALIGVFCGLVLQGPNLGVSVLLVSMLQVEHYKFLLAWNVLASCLVSLIFVLLRILVRALLLEVDPSRNEGVLWKMDLGFLGGALLALSLVLTCAGWGLVDGQVLLVGSVSALVLALAATTRPFRC